MTDHKQLRVVITLPIDPPHPFTAHSAGNPEALATEVLWVRTIAEGDDHTRVIVFAYDGRNCAYDPDDPDWVPRPTGTWHAIVSELAAEVLA